MTHRFEGHVVDGEDVEVDQRLHHRVVQVASPVCHAHPLEVRVVGVEHEGVESRFASRELVYDEVATLRCDSFLMRLKVFLVDLKIADCDIGMPIGNSISKILPFSLVDNLWYIEKSHQAGGTSNCPLLDLSECVSEADIGVKGRMVSHRIVNNEE